MADVEAIKKAVMLAAKAITSAVTEANKGSRMPTKGAIQANLVETTRN